jgi:hypothetical protein
MALATILHLVGTAELAKLRARPTWVNRLRPPDGYTYLTHHACSINYFVGGDAWPSGSQKRPLGGLLFGFSNVRCPTLENGSFGVVAPHQVRWVLDALGALDLATVRRRIEHADEGELEEQEVDDYELLLEEDGEPADVIEAEIEALVELYKRAARGRYAIVSYTT